MPPLGAGSLSACRISLRGIQKMRGAHMRAGQIRFSIVTAALAVVLSAAAAAAPPADTPIKLAPAFDAKQLTTLPTTQWITNGGTVFNQRYSPLKLLNRDNVAGLKALWRT